MSSIAFVASKGGTGKTALAANLAVAAVHAGRRAFLIDLDPQRSLTDWYEARSASEPSLIDVAADRLSEALAAVPADAVAFIDTSPRADEAASVAARLADLVIMPARPTIFDLRALRHAAEMVRAQAARTFVVLNQCPPGRGIAQAGDVADARAALAAYALVAAPITIGTRTAIQRAAINGQSALELEPAGRAADEIRALWSWTWRSLA